ncbi:MAG: serine hydrolase [Desulfobacterales bacterium]|nr:MAG: serine hydrolase [Desulfobacterales bacterium]
MISRQNKKSIVLYIFPVFVVLVSFYSYSTASVTTYPTEGWQFSTPEEQGMRSQRLVEMMEHVKTYNFSIDSILIVRNGYVVLDAYFYPFLKGQKHIIHSCTKSIMSALIGIAIDKGYIKSVDQPITDFFPGKEFANMDDLKKSITLENLLMMASGLKCRDSYLYRWVGLYEMRNSSDWAQYVLDLPMSEAPGERFEYCNGVSYLLSVIIQNTTGMKTLDFARKHLFGPLGIVDVGWATSPQGVDIGYGEMWLKPHDMAKFGWLFLNKGRWSNKQILPSSWVDVSTRGHIGAALFDQYGYQWWVDSEGFYMAVGYKGQFIFVVPQKNLVVVFTSDLSGRHFPIPNLLLQNYIIPAAEASKPLPSNTEEQARLDALVKSVARATPYIWTSEKEGMAKDGVFKRTASPAFNFEYPLGSKKAAIEYPGQVMVMRTPDDVEFSASVGDIPEGIRLEDFGPKFYSKELESVGSNIRVISNKEITLNCGTKAYRTDITWLWNNALPITTYLVSAYRDGKIIFVCTHPWRYHDKAEPIVQSLSFK